MTPMLAAEVEVLLDRYPLRDFLGVLSGGDLLIGPSTGPVHMAAALGLATVGLYPPVPTMAPGRWGPRGGLARTLVPEVACPSKRYCYRESCRYYNCLDRIFERDVLDIALALVKQKQDQDVPGPNLEDRK
jgi:ADP-heptose:LPS heptosyltransferase